MQMDLTCILNPLYVATHMMYSATQELSKCGDVTEKLLSTK